MDLSWWTVRQVQGRGQPDYRRQKIEVRLPPITARPISSLKTCLLDVIFENQDVLVISTSPPGWSFIRPPGMRTARWYRLPWA